MAPTAIVAVLAGGRARRLGGTKASRLLAGRALISYPLAAARAAGLESVVIAKRDSALPAIEEQVLYEAERPRHPLCGVLTALEHASARNAAAIVLVACDMPFLTAALLGWLAQLNGAAIAEIDGRYQPLLGRVLAEQRPTLERALAANSSLTAAMQALAPRVVRSGELSRFGAPARLCFNVNDAAELQRAEEWLA